MKSSIETRLSDRMLAVAGMVGSCGLSVMKEKNTFSVADIGCDHAFISIYLVEKGIADRVIAMDVNEGPLLSAGENIRKYGLADRIVTRLSNGFEKLLPGETDAAVIAGMGGYLILDILKNAACLTKGYKLVLSPQSDLFEVRKYLVKNSFFIRDEELIKDSGKYYNIIYAEFMGEDDMAAGTDAVDIKSDLLRLKYGGCLIDKKHPVLMEYLSLRVEVVKKIISEMDKKGSSDNAKKRRSEIEEELHELTELLKVMGTESW